MSVPRSLQPNPVHSAFVLWLVAVAAGVFETVLAVTDLVSTGAEAGSIIAGVAVRTAVFGAAIFLALRLRHGRNWARMGLAAVLGAMVLMFRPAANTYFREAHS